MPHRASALSWQGVGRLAWRGRALLPLAAFVLVAAMQWLAGIPHVSGDTQTLVTGARAVIDCLEAGELTACEASAAPIYTTVAPFAVLQYLPAVAVLALGGTATTALTTIWALSGLAFVGVLTVQWVVATRTGEAAWAPGLAIVTITGPLLFYANSTFGEMLAAFLAVLLVGALTLRLGWAPVAGAAWLAGIGKETAAPFLLALGLIVIFGARDRSRTVARAQVFGLLLGLALAVAASALFNVFRYGTVTNRLYLEAPGVVQGLDTMPLERRPEFVAALLVSPNGGLLFFWPAAGLLLAGVVAVATTALLGRGALRERWPAVALVGTFAALLVGLASYPYPFGWHTWGPRYTVAWVPAFALAAVVLHGPELARVAGSLVASARRVILTATALTLVALPHVGAFVLPGAFAPLFRPDSDCPAIETLRGERYLDCLSELAWQRRPMLLDGLEGLREGQPGSTWVAGALGVAVFGLLAAMVGRLPAQTRRETPL